MAFIGTPLDTRNTFQSLQGKRFNGDGSTTAFTLDVAPSSTLDIEVFVGNVRQDPNSAYTLSGTTLTFTGAPPSGTNNIYVVHQAKSVGTITPGANTVGVTELNLSDGSNGQFIQTNGSGTISFASAASALDDITTGDAASTLATSAGNITIDAQGGDTDIIFKGTDDTTDTTFLTLDGSDLGTATFNGRILTAQDGDGTTCAISSSNDTNTGINFRPGSNANQIDILTDGTTRLRIRDNGAICSERGAGHSSNSTLQQASDQGLLIRDGDESIYASSSGAFSFNRSNNNDNDLTLLNFFRNGSNPGSITGTNSTVSYNTFIGSHWSQLSDNSKPTILVGTVIESIDKICDWPMVKFTIPADKSPTGVDKVMREYIAKPYTVGANIKHTFDGVEYDGVVELEIQKEHLPKCKISDTEDSTKVYGIFRAWDDNDKVNDLSVASLGAFVVRVHKDETVAIGNLLSSKGDGTAKVQSDGNFKNTTIAKVTSTTKIETYSDGSYTVPCTLHCG